MNKIHIVPHRHAITKADRQKSNRHRSLVLWFTGLSGSGKSTLAGKVEELLFENRIRTYILDGDTIRTGLNNNLGFSQEDRKENIRRIGEAAKLFVDAGLVVLTAFISPYRKDRNSVRNLLNDDEFIEIYVKCSIEICEQRDVKGLYKKARNGEINDFTGVNAPYEEPTNPELTVETDKFTAAEIANEIANYILPKIIKSNNQ